VVLDRIEREILIEAPIEVVWAIVTEPEHLARWFPDAATIDLRPGGEGRLTWNDHGTYRLRVERVEAPHRFSFRWVRRVGVDPVEGASTLVEMSLSADDRGTRLRLVESGFGDLDWPADEAAQYAEENDHGWDVELRELQAYVSVLGGRSLPT